VNERGFEAGLVRVDQVERYPGRCPTR